MAGKLVGFDLENFGADAVKSDQEYIPKALYQYTVANVQYAGTRVSPWVFVVSHNAKFVLEKNGFYSSIFRWRSEGVLQSGQAPK